MNDCGNIYEPIDPNYVGKTVTNVRSIHPIFFLFIVILFLSVPHMSLAEITEFSSKADGRFLTPSTWSLTSSTSTMRTLSCSMADDERLIIRHSLEAQCDRFQVYGTGDITILSGGSLFISGDLELFGEAVIKVDSGAILHVSGNVWLSGNANIAVDGGVVIHGNVEVTGGAEACGDGEASVAGSISGQKWCYDIRLLPVQLLELAAEIREDQGVDVKWQSETITGSGHYILSRSYNGMTYDIISKIKFDDADEAQKFQFTDYPILGRTIYYRITEFDQSANMRASELTAVEIRDNSDQICHLEVHPNPCIPSCIAKLVNCPEGQFTTQILDASGNVISNLIPSAEGSEHIQYYINRDNFLSPGVYIINSANDETRLSKKVIVK